MCDNPIPSARDRLNMILEDLVETLGSPAPSIPSVSYGTDLNNAIRQLQTLMCRDQEGKQMKPEEIVNESTALPRRPTGPTTRSQAYKQEPIGTIVKRKFNNGKWYEGEVTHYDPINKLYKIKYCDGDTEDYNHSEMKEFRN